MSAIVFGVLKGGGRCPVPLHHSLPEHRIQSPASLYKWRQLAHLYTLAQTNKERKFADTIRALPVPWVGHFQR